MLASVIKTTAWTLQYASGLYADLGHKKALAALTLPRNKGTHLALLGNCGSAATASQAKQTTEFLRRCSDTWSTVLWVPGPHELSSGPDSKTYFVEQLDRLQDLVSTKIPGKNVFVMNQLEVPYHKEGVVVIGATGWTDAAGLDSIPMGNPEASTIWTAKEGGGTRNLTLKDIRTWNREDLAWMHREMSRWTITYPQYRKVLLTHHLFSSAFQSAEQIPRLQERRALDSMSPTAFGAAGPYFTKAHPLGPTAWLCGAGGGSTSGFVNGATKLFAGVNCYAPWIAAAAAGGPYSRTYTPNRVLGLSAEPPV